MTASIRRLFGRCNKWHKIAAKTKSEKDINKHKTLRRIAKAAWKQSKFKYYNKLNEKLSNSETSAKAWWKINKNEVGITNKSSVPSLNVDGCVINNDIEKCNALNAYFAGQCKLDVPKSAADFLLAVESDLLLVHDHISCTLDNIYTSEDEISEILGLLNVRCCLKCN